MDFGVRHIEFPRQNMISISAVLFVLHGIRPLLMNFMILEVWGSQRMSVRTVSIQLEDPLKEGRSLRSGRHVA